ncbi:MAG: DNA-binding protein [Bacteroidales bacterium]|nr:DNA-binding protein [Bacteroidales bacterium]
MRYSEAKKGRVFILRLEDKELLQDSIERFACEKQIMHAEIQLLGGVDKGSKLIVGPEKGRNSKVVPMVITLDEMHEAIGNGTIIPNTSGEPKLHCHICCGRGAKTICGEIREGVIVWHVMEVIISEITNCSAIRKRDKNLGFELLYPEN